MISRKDYWKLFEETGDIALYLMYREEMSAELTDFDTETDSGRTCGRLE